MKKHVNIPIFIPHYGCPNDCVFCNQRKITGKPNFDGSEVISEIDRALETVGDDCEKELAFFGGSFTALPREEMLSLLDISDRYLEKGLISSVRLSTRPDAVDTEVLDILRSHGVQTVELGIQSFSDKVLELSKRGHTASDSENACKLVKEYGFSLIGQMMVGLPGSSVSDEVATAEKLCALGADGARIYPTVVFPDTELDLMKQSGSYAPLTNEESAERTAEVLDIFARKGINVIRIGLCANETLQDSRYENNFHPAIGEIAKSKVFLKYMRRILKDCPKTNGRLASFTVAQGALSQAIGQHRINIDTLKSEFSLADVRISEDQHLSGYGIQMHLLSL